MAVGRPRSFVGARLAAVLAAALVLGGCGGKTPVDTTGADVAANLKTISGLPQDGITLGSPDAMYTLTVFDSLDSFNRGFFLSDLPELVTQYVRGGRLKVEVETLTGFDTGQSPDTGAADAARLAQAAGLQQHLWDFYGALSARYIGTIDQGVLTAALADVRGIDTARAQSDARGAEARSAIDAANKLAADQGVTDLPHYTLTRGNAAPVPLDGSCQGCLLRSLARAIAGAPSPSATPAASPTPEPVTPRDARRTGRTVGETVPTPTVTVTATATVTATP
ncbi:MAG: hypothetical protein QOF76_294 [Solirubrobacteraceae bacterium]|nr:hypothetical protein [Solirubrobacteraceae bacterium]